MTFGELANLRDIRTQNARRIQAIALSGIALRLSARSLFKKEQAMLIQIANMDD